MTKEKETPDGPCLRCGKPREPEMIQSYSAVCFWCFVALWRLERPS